MQTRVRSKASLPYAAAVGRRVQVQNRERATEGQSACCAVRMVSLLPFSLLKEDIDLFRNQLLTQQNRPHLGRFW